MRRDLFLTADQKTGSFAICRDARRSGKPKILLNLPFARDEISSAISEIGYRLDADGRIEQVSDHAFCLEG